MKYSMRVIVVVYNWRAYHPSPCANPYVLFSLCLRFRIIIFEVVYTTTVLTLINFHIESRDFARTSKNN